LKDCKIESKDGNIEYDLAQNYCRIFNSKVLGEYGHKQGEENTRNGSTV